MAASDLPSDEWDSSHNDNKVTNQKNQPNSWTIQKIAASEPQPQYQALIPPLSPIIPWLLNHNDLKLLKSLKIGPE